jgi:hypothetical protein
LTHLTFNPVQLNPPHPAAIPAHHRRFIDVVIFFVVVLLLVVVVDVNE